MKKVLALTILLLFSLAACQPETLAPPTETRPVPSMTVESTAEPVDTTPIVTEATSTTAPTPAPTIEPTAGLNISQLKLRVLDAYPDFFYCDPDYYPIQVADEQALALERFDELQANQEEFQAILDHLGLSGQARFTDEEILRIYQEHKRLAALELEPAGSDYRFTVQIVISTGEGFTINGLVSPLDGTITEQTREPSVNMCPICLAEGTMIDTPLGPVPVEKLAIGDPVWTVDAAGRRVAGLVVRHGRTLVPATHQVVHLRLADGRELWVSPGHPTAGGRTVGQLAVGDKLDGATVIFLERVRYQQPATYDILPSGKSGLYWANGILLGSTLR